MRQAWRRRRRLPAQGERVDALDLSGKWQEAEVIHLSEDGSMVRVHYIGWQSHWDETITFASGRVRPAFTTLKPWREGVRVGDSVEVRNPHNRLQWVWARVSAVDETARRVQCGDRREWVDLDGEDITPTNTHFAESFGREAVKLRSLPEPVDEHIHRAVAIGDENTVRALLAADRTQVNRVGRDRMTPLLIACAHHRLNLVRLLIAAGANLESVNRTFRGCLHLTVFHRSPPRPSMPVVRALLAGGADCNKQDLRLATPHTMAAENQPDVAMVLIEWGADVTLSDMGGATSLHMAAFAGHEALVRALLRAGADPSARDSLGQLPSDLACLRHVSLHPHRPSILRLLRDARVRADLKKLRLLRDSRWPSSGRLASRPAPVVTVGDNADGAAADAFALDMLNYVTRDMHADLFVELSEYYLAP